MLFLALLIWALVGGVFGYARAKVKYREEIACFSILMKTEPGWVIRNARIEAVIVFLKYMVLGFLAAVAYLFIYIMVLAKGNQENL